MAVPQALAESLLVGLVAQLPARGALELGSYRGQFGCAALRVADGLPVGVARAVGARRAGPVAGRRAGRREQVEAQGRAEAVAQFALALQHGAGVDGGLGGAVLEEADQGQLVVGVGPGPVFAALGAAGAQQFRLLPGVGEQTGSGEREDPYEVAADPGPRVEGRAGEGLQGVVGDDPRGKWPPGQQVAQAQQVRGVQHRSPVPVRALVEPRGQGLAADGDPVGLLLFSLEQQGHPERPQGAHPGPRGHLLRACGGQRPLQVAARGMQVAAAGPVEAGPGGQVQGPLRGGGGQVVVEGRTQVRVHRLDAPVPGPLGGAEPVPLGGAHELGEVRGVRVPQRLALPGLVAPHGPVLPDRVQHPVRAVRAPAYDGLGDQGVEQRRDLRRGERGGGADGSCGRLVEGSPEHGQPQPQQPFARCAPLVAPADGGAQRAVAGRLDGGGRGQRADPAGEPLGQFLDGVVGQLRGGQFQREGYPFEAGAHGAGGREPGLGPGRCLSGGGSGGPPGEQGEGLLGAGRVRGVGQRADVQDAFVRESERLPAGEQQHEVRRRVEQLPYEVPYGRHQVLAAIQYEEQPALADPLPHRCGRGPGGVVGEVQGVGHGGHEQPLVVERGEVGPVDPVGEGAHWAGGPGRVGGLGCGEVGRAAGQAGLADAARPGQGDQPLILQGPIDQGQFTGPPHEGGGAPGLVPVAMSQHPPSVAYGAGAGGAVRIGRGPGSGRRGRGAAPLRAADARAPRVRHR
ncbi:hypothetical protein [Streptomyces sp. NBC_01264]|uniref:hypothetical protein n=1 Tax=Streptomyces sp. NBC_01264 TaxID=2903804 RepID=UPI00225AD598|nr:hypothetical protein [Streptomyces sp. NBC_01264]MCX4782254.1 hypothetical protein [Streptomyces sp. NBC_01264]